jgi:hypothetical protein
MPEHLKTRVRGKKVLSRSKGLALQCCIKDETSGNRKKFVLASLSEIQPSTKLELYFDSDQIPNLTLEAKGRPHLNKSTCSISLTGFFTVNDVTNKEILDMAKEFTTNKAQEIKKEIIQKRKELPEREEKKKKKDYESESEEEELEPEE